MGRPHAYYTKDRVRVPSVTTIIKHVEADNEGLLRWAHRLGTEGVPLDQAREQAAGVGSITHAAIEADLKGEVVDLSSVPEETRSKVDQALAAWRMWRESSALTEVLGVEVPLVSERHRYGGTMDSVMVVQGQRSLFDFKTGNKLWPKDLVQIGAYGMLWNEVHPDAPIERFVLLRLGKEEAEFTWKQVAPSSMAPAFEAFLRARSLYDLARSLQKMVA